jgi:uncharacterized protein (DUF1330 family)
MTESPNPNEHFLIIWTDTVPSQEGLAEGAREHAGELLAAGPVHDVSELESRPAPAGLVVARFGLAEDATAWLETTARALDGTALLAAGATAPVWWPPEREASRPDWSRRAELPRDRLGQFVSVWAEVTDLGSFLDYSVHYRWTVENAGGVVLVPGPKPSQVVLRGDRGPHATALMAWPADGNARRAWYAGPEYRSYRDQRHRSSHTTNVSVIASHLGE